MAEIYMFKNNVCLMCMPCITLRVLTIKQCGCPVFLSMQRNQNPTLVSDTRKYNYIEQKHRMVDVGRDFWGSPGPTPSLK